MARSRLNAFLHMKCPRCHEGDMFEDKNFFKPSTIHQMPSCCPVCKEPFFPEPGFYYGAMYVNYGFATILFLISWGLSVWFKWNLWLYISLYVVGILLITPVLFRYSRVLYLYFFVSYDGSESVKDK